MSSSVGIARDELPANTSAQQHDTLQVVEVHTVGCKAIFAARQLHRFVRFDLLGVHECVQKFAVECQAGLGLALVIGHRSTYHLRIADQLDLGCIAIGDGFIGRGSGQATLLIE